MDQWFIGIFDSKERFIHASDSATSLMNMPRRNRMDIKTLQSS